MCPIECRLLSINLGASSSRFKQAERAMPYPDRGWNYVNIVSIHVIHRVFNRLFPRVCP